MRASTGLGKIACTNWGSLEVDRISWEDWGFDQTPFLFYGDCHPYVHDNTFYGSGPGEYVSQNNAVNLGDMAHHFFQGYSAVIDLNYFARIAEAMFAGEKGNGPVFTNNTIGNSSGGTFAVLYNGTTYGAQLGYRAGNLYELTNYAYAIGFINAVGNEGFGEQFWDSSQLGIYDFYLSGTSTGNACWGCGNPGNSGWTYYDATGSNPMAGFGDFGGNSQNGQTLGGLDSLYLGDPTHLARGLIRDTSAAPVWEMLIPGAGDQKLSFVKDGPSSSHLAFTNPRPGAVPYTFDGSISAAGDFEATRGGFKMDACPNPAYVLTAGGRCAPLSGIGNTVQIAQAYAPTILSVTATQNNLIEFTPASCAKGVCQFRLCAYIKVVTAGTGGTFQWAFSYTIDGEQLSDIALTRAVHADTQHQAPTGANYSSNCQNFDADPGVAITAKLAASRVSGSPTVRVSATLEQLQ